VKTLVGFSPVVVLIAFAVSSQAQDAKQPAAENSALERFKQLAGEWVGKGMHGGMEHDVRANYKVTSGGSAVMETIDPGSPHEMVTVIHADGNALALTHYCMLGNQPQMKATPKANDDKVAFEFVKATNLKSDKDMYMRSVTFSFTSKDTFRAEWTMFKDGKQAERAVFEMKRSK
jgi:hypothetical protein